jgi:hypothetical protein
MAKSPFESNIHKGDKIRFVNWLKRYFYTENYLYRLFGIIVILILMGVGLRNWLEYRSLDEEIANMAYDNAKTLQEYFTQFSIFIKSSL